jgi:hypothetical protein
VYRETSTRAGWPRSESGSLAAIELRVTRARMLGAMAVLPSAASRLPRCRRTGHQLVAAPLVDGTSGAEVKADADATREVVARESSIDRASFSALVRQGGITSIASPCRSTKTRAPRGSRSQAVMW